MANYIPISKGKKKIAWNMVVADIDDNILLGIYFLDAIQAVINLRDNLVSINNQPITSVFLRNEVKSVVNVYRLYVVEEVVVAPFLWP